MCPNIWCNGAKNLRGGTKQGWVKRWLSSDHEKDNTHLPLQESKTHHMSVNLSTCITWISKKNWVGTVPTEQPCASTVDLLFVSIEKKNYTSLMRGCMHMYMCRKSTVVAPWGPPPRNCFLIRSTIFQSAIFVRLFILCTVGLWSGGESSATVPCTSSL
jgi:hypothetical protein